MNRDANFKDVKEKINMCKKYINNINVDLIYAIPGESIFTLKKDLRLIKKLKINHVSTYSLMIEPNTVIYNKHINPIEDTLDLKMYNIIRKILKRYGFNHYEISNFSKKGYESKHNLVYWNNKEYYGFGLGASGYIDDIRYTNTKSLSDYLNDKYIKEEEILSDKDKMDYEIILGLRKINGINVKEFHDKYHVNIQSKYEIEKLLKTKELIYKKGNIFINPDKLYIMNEILLKLV
jgi:oxygen-independent coproporphyrinogen-3 oxidase